MIEMHAEVTRAEVGSMHVTIEFTGEDQASAMLAWLHHAKHQCDTLASAYPYDDEFQRNVQVELRGLDHAIEAFERAGVRADQP